MGDFSAKKSLSPKQVREKKPIAPKQVWEKKPTAPKQVREKKPIAPKKVREKKPIAPKQAQQKDISGYWSKQSSVASLPQRPVRAGSAVRAIRVL